MVEEMAELTSYGNVRPSSGPSSRTIEVDLDRVVDELDTLLAATTLDLALRVGELLIGGIFGGDIELFRLNGRREPAYQRLLRHPRLRLSATTLWRALRVYELCQRLPWIRGASSITVTHLYAVLGLSPDQQEALLRQVELEGWLAQKLELEAKTMRRPGGRGRPRASALEASIRFMKRFLEQPFPDSDQLKVQASDPSAVKDMRRLLDAIRQRCNALEAAITPRLRSPASSAR